MDLFGIVSFLKVPLPFFPFAPFSFLSPQSSPILFVDPVNFLGQEVPPSYLSFIAAPSDQPSFLRP